MEIMAPAKINLYLEVFNRRDDGYHNIGTLFERISIFDRIIVDLSDLPTEIKVTTADIPVGPGSLLHNTIAAFKRASGIRADFKIKIEKNIPVAAGMGGGSSDSASLLMALNNLTKNPLKTEQLVEIARSLGADVPFFLKNTSFGLGKLRGDEVVPVETDLKLGHVIVNPPLEIHTKSVYERVSGLNLTKDEAWATMLTLFLGKKDIVSLAGYLRNDLQQIVLREFPLVGEAISFFPKNKVNIVAHASSFVKFKPETLSYTLFV